MTDIKMQDMKMTGQMTGHEVAGQKDKINRDYITMQSKQQVKMHITTK